MINKRLCPLRLDFVVSSVEVVLLSVDHMDKLLS